VHDVALHAADDELVSAVAVAEHPPRQRHRPVRQPAVGKRELHLLAGVAVAALTVAFAAQHATNGARAVLDARLLQAGAGTDAGIVDVESEQLSLARAISFTHGVAQDVAAHDSPALNTLVAPVQADSTVPMVDVVLPNGSVLLAVRSKGAPMPVSSHAGLPALKWALSHAHGPRGGRLSQVVVFASGATLVTISPIVEEQTPVGAVLAMTPLADVLGRLSQEVGADLTAYDGNGNPVDTTAEFQPPPIDRTVVRALLGGGAVVTRSIHGSQREKLGRLIVDHTADAVLGVSLEDDSAAVGRTVAIYAGIGLTCTVLILATFWARFVTTRSRE